MDELWTGIDKASVETSSMYFSLGENFQSWKTFYQSTNLFCFCSISDSYTTTNSKCDCSVHFNVWICLIDFASIQLEYNSEKGDKRIMTCQFMRHKQIVFDAPRGLFLLLAKLVERFSNCCENHTILRRWVRLLITIIFFT